MTELRGLVEDVLRRDACSGCGLCALLDRGIRMRLDDNGYMRPESSGPPKEITGAATVFRRACPGVQVRAPRVPGGTRDHLLGDYVEAWEAWAIDPSVRYAGSSGGVLTALNAWLLESGRASRVTGVAASHEDPRRSVPVTMTTREEAIRSTGSRYAPVAALDNPDVLNTQTAVTGKPCEVAALRAASCDLDLEPPILLSFFCAGTPSQHATQTLLETHGLDPGRRIDDLWYRGRGWPGKFTARSGHDSVEVPYEESWGEILGPRTQWRCKICVDAVGQSADVVAADSWTTDAHGYPAFDDQDGVSAVIARTERGREAVLSAAAAGVIALRPLAMSQLHAAQPLQTNRRRQLLARLLGSWLAGRRPPRYICFRLVRLALISPVAFARVARGTYRRVKSARRDT